MAAETELHDDRDRAESFGSVAESYDRFRPGYPAALMDDLAALRPADVLDIGCGTGKAAVMLAERGLHVIGMEIDERMAQVARSHGITVEVGAFETWDDAGRQFDLLTCGQAWHWIDPELGRAKAARLLRSGGTCARFWNMTSLEEPVRLAFEAVYQEHAPMLLRSVISGQAQRPGGAPQEDDDSETFRGDEAFTDFEVRNYESTLSYCANDWVGLVSTHSDHVILPADELDRLQAALHTAIEHFGGTIEAHIDTFALLARRR